MIRTILATVSVAFAAVTLAAPAAQACVSCEYKPEVLSAGAGAKPQKRARVDKVVKARKQRPAKENVAERKASSRKAARAESRKTPSEAKVTETTATVTTEGASEPTSTHSHSVYNTLIKTTEPIDRSADAPPVTSQGTQAATPPSTAAAPDVASPKKIDTAVAEPLIAEVPPEAETAPAQPKTSGSSETVSVSQDKGDKATGCKKFFPMADLTLTVDCK